LSPAGHRLLSRVARAGDAPRLVGVVAHHGRDAWLLRRLRLPGVAHGGGGVLHRRPDLRRGLVPTAARAARGVAERILAGGGAGAVSRRPLLFLRDPADDRLAAQRAPLSVADPRGLHLRRRRLPLPQRRALGGAAPELHTARRRGAGPRG